MKAIALKRAWICTLGIVLIAVCLPIKVQQGRAEEIRETGLYFPLQGYFLVTGNTENWHTIVGGGWSGTLFLLNVKVIWPGNRSGYMEIEGFRPYLQKNRFQSEITYPEPPEGVELSIRVYGLPEDETPGVLKFRKTVRIEKGAGQYYPLEKGDFTIDGKKPSTMEHLVPFTIEESGKFYKKNFLYPLIALNFESPFKSSKKSWPDTPTATSQDNPPATPQPKSQFPLTSFFESDKSGRGKVKMPHAGWGENLKVVLKDSAGTIRDISIWEDPSEAMRLPSKLNYSKIQLITPFGPCECINEKNLSNRKKLLIEDCINKLHVTVKGDDTAIDDATICLSYSKNGGYTWVPFHIIQTGISGGAVLYLPKKSAHNNILWKLEVKKEAYGTREVLCGNLSGIKKNKIELELSKDENDIKFDFDLFIIKIFSEENNTSDLMYKNEITKKQNKINSKRHCKKVQYIYTLQDSYKNTLREFQHANQQLRHLDGKKEIISHQISDMEKAQGAYHEAIGLIEKKKRDLEKSLQIQLPPTFAVQVAAYRTSDLRSEAENEYDLLAKSLSAGAEEQYMLFLNTKGIRQQDSYSQLQSHTKYPGNNYSTVLDQLRLAMPVCDSEKKKQKKIRYYMTALYFVESVGHISSSGAISEKKVSTLQKKDTFSLDNMEQQTLDNITFCEDQDRARLNNFFIRVKEQKKQADDNGKSWVAFWASQDNKIKEIEKNTIEKEKINKKIKEIQTNIEKFKQKLDRVSKDKTEITTAIENLKGRANKEFESYLMAIVKQEFSVAAEGTGKNQNQAVCNLLKRGEELVRECFHRDIIEVIYGSTDINRQEDWIFNIRSKLIKASPLAWLRNGENFTVAADITYQLKIPEKLLPILAYEEKIEQLLNHGLHNSEPDKSGIIYRNIIKGKELWHIGYSPFGYTYQKVQEFCTQNGGGWSLPSSADMDSIMKQGPEQRGSFKVIESFPYWTKDRAPNGDLYGYCFGKTGDCKECIPEKFKTYPESWGLAVILIRVHR